MKQAAEEKLAKTYGATSIPDTARGSGWHTFELNGWRIWVSARGWTCARLINNHWCDHTYHSTLEAAFKEANGRSK